MPLAANPGHCGVSGDSDLFRPAGNQLIRSAAKPVDFRVVQQHSVAAGPNRQPMLADLLEGDRAAPEVSVPGEQHVDLQHRRTEVDDQRRLGDRRQAIGARFLARHDQLAPSRSQPIRAAEILLQGLHVAPRWTNGLDDVGIWYVRLSGKQRRRQSLDRGGLPLPQLVAFSVPAEPLHRMVLRIDVCRRMIPLDVGRFLHDGRQFAFYGQRAEAALGDDDPAPLVCIPAEPFVAHQHIVLAGRNVAVGRADRGRQMLFASQTPVEYTPSPQHNQQALAQQANIEPYFAGRERIHAGLRLPAHTGRQFVTGRARTRPGHRVLARRSDRRRRRNFCWG